MIEPWLLIVAVAILAGTAVSETGQGDGRVWFDLLEDAEHGSAPESHVVEKHPDSLVINLKIPGVYFAASASWDTLKAFQVPGEKRLTEPGKPMLPQVVLLVACPEFDDIKVEWSGDKYDTLGSCFVYPAPLDVEFSREADRSGSGEVYLDPTVYEDDSLYPEEGVIILHIGRIRDQKVVWVGIHPIRYNGLRQEMVSCGEMILKFKYKNARPSLATSGIGPFDGICSRMLVGYEEGQAEEPLRLLATENAGMTWASNLQDCIDNSTDYLIIAADRFCSGPDSVVLQGFAEFRTDSSHFNTSVMNVTDIGTSDSAIKNFIKSLYDSRSAGHWWDGHLGFVLLVGDYQAPDGTQLIPVHLVDSQWKGEPDAYAKCASDNWYACVTDDPIHPAVMLGRLSVDSTSELQRVVGKIVNYEPIPDSSWSGEMLLTASRPLESMCSFERQWATASFNAIETLALDAGFDTDIIRGDTLCPCSGTCSEDLLQMNIDSASEGKYFIHYVIHGSPCEMGYQLPRAFTVCSVEEIANKNKHFIFTSMGSNTGRFNYDDSCAVGCEVPKYDCIGERFVNSTDSAAVAFVGQTDAGHTNQVSTMDIDFYESVFHWKVPVLGEAFAAMMIQETDSHYVNRFAILGDPALRIRYKETQKGKWDLWALGDSESIWFDPPIDSPNVPHGALIRALIRNASAVPLDISESNPAVAIRFWIRDPGDSLILLGSDYVRTLAPWSSDTVSTYFEPLQYGFGEHEFRVEIDPDSSFATDEAYRDNNAAVVKEYVGLRPAPSALPDTTSDCPTLAYLRKPSGEWEHFALFPLGNSELWAVDGGGNRTSWSFDARNGPLHSPAVAASQNSTPIVLASQDTLWCIDIFSSGYYDQVVWLESFGDTALVTPPSIADFDGDGDLDVAVGGKTAGDSGVVFRIDVGTGDRVGSATGLGDRVPSCALATVDLNADGNPDILVGTSNTRLVAIDGASGAEIESKKVTPSTTEPVTAVAVGDLDFDGFAEVVACADFRFKVFRADTTLKPRFALPTSLSPYDKIKGLAIADALDNPDTLCLEMVFSALGEDSVVSVVTCKFDSIQGITRRKEFEVEGALTISAPVVGDMHPNSGPEIAFFVTEPGGQTGMYWWNPHDDALVGYVGGLAGAVRSAVLQDFEGDQYPEIVFASDGDKKVWGATGLGDGREMMWPMAHGDERCRNVYAVTLRDTLPQGRTTLWGRYSVPDHVWIAAEDSVSISAGTTLRFVPSDTDPPSIFCLGDFEVTGRSDAPIVFTSASPSPSPGDWGYLRVKSGTDLSFEHVIMEYSTGGLHLARTSGSEMCTSGGDITIENCEFSHNESNGIYASLSTAAADNFTIDNCLFKENGVAAVTLPYGYAEITDCRFVKDSVSTGGTSVYAIKLGEGLGYNECFEGCYIRNNYFDTGEDLHPDTCFWDYAIAIFGADGGDSVVIKKNFINSFYQGGIWIEDPNSPINIYSNCVRSAEVGYSGFGMKFTGSGTDTAIVRDNIIFQNDYGVVARSDPFPILGDSLRTVTVEPGSTKVLGYNHLVNNYDCVKSDSARTLKAEMCWWGEEPDENDMIGIVDYTPWLREEPSGVDDIDDASDNCIYALRQSYPNPLVGEQATIRFSVAKACHAVVAVYNVLGQQVAVLHRAKVEPGWQQLFWDARNQAGRKVSPGLYFYRLETSEYQETRKMVILR